jgi:predicted phage terminase large subunit-like protein
VLLVSSEADFAAEWGRRARDILKEHGPRTFGLTVREDLAAADRWEIARYGGGMATAGVGGQITGRGAHFLIIDDPIKNWEQAQSASFRDKLWEWYNSTARPRLEPGALIVLVMARWHEDDLAGRLILQMQADPSADRFKIIRLPAIAEENDLLGRKPGDPLWPERYDTAALDKIRHSVGFRIWNALYQQSPCSSEAALFRRERFQFVDMPLLCVKTVRFWDMAATEATQDTDPDYTVGAKLGIDRFNRVTILDIRRLRGTPRQVEELIRHTALEDGAGVLVRIEQEPGSAGKAVVDHYRDILRGFDVRGVPASGNKVSRAKPMSEFVETGNLLLLRASWNAVLLDELEAFPNGLHDDQVDACSGAFSELSVVANTTPEVETEADKLPVETLTYEMGLKLNRAWYLSGPMLCCVWFQVYPHPWGEQVRVLREVHSDTEWASSFVGQVMETTRKQYLAAQHPHDILIVPKLPYDDDTKENISALWKQGVHARHVRWDPEQFNTVFGEILEAGAVSVDKGCPAIVEAIRGGCGRKLSGGVAVDSYLEPLARTVTGGIAAVFTVAPPPLE